MIEVFSLFDQWLLKLLFLYKEDISIFFYTILRLSVGEKIGVANYSAILPLFFDA